VCCGSDGWTLQKTPGIKEALDAVRFPLTPAEVSCNFLDHITLKKSG